MTTTSATVGPVTEYYGTGSGAIAETITPGDGYKLVSVQVHNGTSPAAVENIVITDYENAGSAYYTVLNTTGMAGVTDFVWQPSGDYYFGQNDSLRVAWTNTSAVTYGLTVTFLNV
jgi:hypothetical protein